MNLKVFLGFFRRDFWLFIALVTIIVSSLPVIPSPAFAKVDLDSCLQQLLGTRNNHLAVSASSKMYTAAPGITVLTNVVVPRRSLTEKAGVVRLGEQSALLPRATTINNNYGLIEGQSQIYFIEMAGGAGGRHDIAAINNLTVYLANGDLHPDTYHFLIALGYVALAPPELTSKEENFSHDVLDHVPGFKKLSETVYWPKIKRLLLETLYAEANLPYTSPVYQVAAQIRFDVAALLETYTTKLSRDDQAQRSFLINLHRFSIELEKNLVFWRETISVFNFTVPNELFQFNNLSFGASDSFRTR